MQGISVSRINLYEECPRKYRYQYIDKLPQKEKPYFVLGSFVHQILERCVKSIIGGISIKAAMRSALQLTYEQTPIPTAMLSELRPWLRTFVESWNVNAHPVKTEASFAFTLADNFRVRGIIDRIDEEKDGIHVIDYKTSRSASRLTDFQLAVYAAALRNSKYPKEPIIAWYSMVRFGFKQENRLVVSDKLINQTLERLHKVGTQLEQEDKWPVNRTSTCQFCDFFQVCFTESPVGSWN